ncbi:MAG: DNA/RNA nuclease SfsA [Bdellovibrionales bacterium]|nr:DNA/RNA nuclease SfsA [Bdellovibrionales bacterium]
MKLPQPVEEGHFLKRYKRFFADINYNSAQITAHVPNTGSLKTCLHAQADCRFSVNDDPKRKLKYTLQTSKTPTSWVGVNTSLANDLVWEAWREKKIAHWNQYNFAKREVKVSEHTRFDMAFWQKDLGIDPQKKIASTLFDKAPFHFVEVKNVTMALEGVAYFPDAVTTRGQKHLVELMKWVEKGHTSEIVFVIQRTDCNTFSPAEEIDPEYAKLLRMAHKKGVRVSPYACKISKTQISLDLERSIKLLL